MGGEWGALAINRCSPQARPVNYDRVGRGTHLDRVVAAAREGRVRARARPVVLSAFESNFPINDNPPTERRTGGGHASGSAVDWASTHRRRPRAALGLAGPGPLNRIYYCGQRASLVACRRRGSELAEPGTFPAIRRSLSRRRQLANRRTRIGRIRSLPPTASGASRKPLIECGQPSPLSQHAGLESSVTYRGSWPRRGRATFCLLTGHRLLASMVATTNRPGPRSLARARSEAPRRPFWWALTTGLRQARDALPVPSPSAGDLVVGVAIDVRRPSNDEARVYLFCRNSPCLVNGTASAQAARAAVYH